LKSKGFSGLVLAALLVSAAASEIPIWPDKPPGETAEIGPEKDTTKPTDNLVGSKPVVRLGNVSQPTIRVYRAKDSANGTGVLVFPGGAYRILAMDLEGTEVCEWLNSLGVTAVLLKYRVPSREGVERHAAALQDAQRAFGIVRHRAKEFGIDPQRLGVLGFSAGAHLAATLATSSSGPRSYPKVDAADGASCRPDFSMLIYPGYLTAKEDNRIPPEVAVTTNTPPTFLAMTQDDPVRVENVLFYGLALKQAKVPFELHVYPTGGHGYGLRKSDHFAITWPDRAADWLRSRGLLKP
jgi:acetyl esterase/lipase